MWPDLHCFSLPFCFLVLPSPSSPSAHDVFSSPVTPSSGARRNLMVNFGSSSPAQTAQPVTLSPTTRQTTARNAPTCKLNFQISRISVNASCTTLKENYHTEFFFLPFDDLSYIFKQENSLQSFHAIRLHLGF